MLIDKIRDDMIRARQGDDAVAKSLLVTLYSEVFMVGKNKRNGPTTDDEAISVIRKFSANAEETRKLLEARGQNTTAQVQELVLLAAYMPQQMTQAALTQAVQQIVADLNVTGVKAMGTVMSELKARHAGAYDGKLASQVVKNVLA